MKLIGNNGRRYSLMRRVHKTISKYWVITFMVIFACLVTSGYAIYHKDDSDSGLVMEENYDGDISVKMDEGAIFYVGLFDANGNQIISDMITNVSLLFHPTVNRMDVYSGENRIYTIGGDQPFLLVEESIEDELPEVMKYAEPDGSDLSTWMNIRTDGRTGVMLIQDHQIIRLYMHSAMAIHDTDIRNLVNINLNGSNIYAYNCDYVTFDYQNDEVK